MAWHRESSDRESGVVSVVVWARNREAILEDLLHRLLALTEVQEIVVVNDGSTDATAAIAEDMAGGNRRLRVVHNRAVCGRAESLKAGFAVTLGEIVVTQDADLKYDPGDVRGVVEPILSGRADVVFGSRFLAGYAMPVPAFRAYLAGKLLAFASNVFTNLHITDVLTGCKAFRGEIIRNMRIRAGGIGFDVEVLAKVAKLGCRVFEVPVHYGSQPLDQTEPMFVSPGPRSIWAVLWYNLFCSARRSYYRMPKPVDPRKPDGMDSISSRKS